MNKIKHKCISGQAVIEWCVFGAISLIFSFLMLRSFIGLHTKDLNYSLSVFSARQALSRSVSPVTFNSKAVNASSMNVGKSTVITSSPNQNHYRSKHQIYLPKKEGAQAYKSF